MKADPVTGRKVCFVGGPEAGNVRLIPESHGDLVRGDQDWIYKIWPLRMPGSKDVFYMGCSKDQHPLAAIVDMWREYQPSIQIRRKISP